MSTSRDETFHGYNPDDNVLPTEAPIRTDTLIHTGQIGGEPRLFYSASLFTTGNGIVNADLALTGLPEGVLFSVPFVSWFSPLHRQSLKFGWWNTSLRFGGHAQSARRVRAWYEPAAIPVAQFSGGVMGRTVDVRASLYAEPGKAEVVQWLRLENRSDAEVEVTVTMSGAARPGEEAGSFYDAVNGTVGRGRVPNPTECAVQTTGSSILIRNESAGVFVRLDGSVAPVSPKFEKVSVDLPARGGALQRPTLRFEIPYRLTLEPKGCREFTFTVSFANHRQDVARPPSPTSMGRAIGQWRRRLAHVEALETPDRLLTAALRRSAAYALSLGYEMAERDELIFHSDHLEWPVDCARDCYHIANSLLLLEPEMVKKHLRFYFLNAIPNAGPGKSYIGQGVSRGQRDARLLDLAAYPLRELYRYWRATGDDAFVADPQVRSTVERIVGEVAAWRNPETGLFSSTERSSDERCVYPYFIPGNMLFVATLERLTELCEEVWGDDRLKEAIGGLARSGREGIYRHAVGSDPEFGDVFAFEVGESGECLLYDHADIPNLISAARFGFCGRDDPIYRNTLRFLYSPRNQGYRGTRDGKYAALCDGSKTMPHSPWPLGAMSHLMSCCASGEEARRWVEWLRDCLTPSLQLPEICDKHTGGPIQRYWFGWPTAMLLMVYIETICGVKIGKEISFEPLAPAGWREYRSPILTIRGERLQIIVTDGEARTVGA
ncbi:MAG: glycoside hydrolase family 125 protein [Armatimonadetes bacterium]|nr:glycoside hydrolase family 125 protein [Armatimonadota bacterium]